MIFLSFIGHFSVGLLTLLVLLIAYYKWSFLYWKKRNIPYIEPTIPFGNLMNMVTRKISRIEELTLLYNNLKAKGYKHCGIWQLAAPTYFVLDLDMLKNILIKDFDHFVDRGFYCNEKDDPIGCHLFAIEGDRWKKMRKQASTIFTATKLKGMFQILQECGNNMQNYIDNLIENSDQPVNMKDIASSFTADTVGSSTMGIKCRSFTDTDKNFMNHGRQALETDRKGQLRLLFGQFFPDFARKLGLRQIKKEVSDFFYKVILDTVDKRKKNNVERNDFLQLLMNMKENSNGGSPLSTDDLVALSFGLFIGGFETSASSFTFCVYYLALHQNIQDKVREEVKRVTAKYNNEITYDCLSELTYMQQVFDETWRLNPPAHTVNRVCTKDYKVPGEDLVIEKGTQVLVTITGIHQDKEYYHNPTEFDPEHFNAENSKNRHPFAFIPFGAGPRICIGERFGKMSLKSAMALLLRRYRITLAERTLVPLKLCPTPFVPVAEGGVWVHFQKL
uniref:Cytochrome P450 n=1 Tax=Phaedon brassicae TaxID=154011 RepID=A0A9Y1LMY5_9CUCU|nr:cytochrome P450 [Phaedon brassicae]